MGFTVPKINTVSTDIKDVSIYLRSVKKWGKSTLFRDVIIEKYGDLSKGVLVECGLENGDSMLNSNMVHLDTYKEFVEFKKWLINGKGTEHNIEMVCFDTADEAVTIFEQEIIKRHNVENPQKPCKSILSAFGGYNSGRQMTADLIKKYIGEIKRAGFGVWVIAHSKFKTIREKGGLEEDGYMQLTSNLVHDYESAFGDIFDCTLTGVIDRVFDEKTDGKTTKKYATDSVRKLYFRGTTLIDAGGRFASNTVPDYLEYNCDSREFAKLFIKTVEDGLKGSAIDVSKVTKPAPKKSTPAPAPKPTPEDDFSFDDEPVTEETTDEIDEPVGEEDKETLMTEIRASFKEADADTKAKVKAILKEQGSGKLDDSLPISVLIKISEILG